MIVQQHNEKGEYVCQTEDYGGPMPHNCVAFALPALPWERVWPVLNAQRTAFILIEDHRERTVQVFEEHAQEATPYWLPDDTYQSSARHMDKLGPLPDGAVLQQPEKPLSAAQNEKRRKIDAGYEAALIAALTMPSAAPSPMTVAVETSALLAVDPDGVDSIKAVLDIRRAELRAQVDAILIRDDMDNAAAVAAVQAIVINFPI